MVARVGFMLAPVVMHLALQQPPVGPPPSQAPARPTTTAPAAPPLPVLTRDARTLVDQATLRLLQELGQLEQQYQLEQRPDDAAAVRAQMKLLRQATGVTESAGQTERPKVDMTNYRDRVGQSFVFTVTGSVDEPVWGTGVYTEFTALEGAAVHAGALRSGQTGEVHVTVLPGQASYVPSTRNGITSMSAASAAGSYRIGASPAPSVSRPTSISGFRGRIGEVLTVPIVGSTSGSVWGTDVYTDDSSLAAAAVHAGVLGVGEFGFVRVTMLEGRPAYVGSPRGGVTSQNYGEFQGSFQVTAAPQPWVIKLPDDVADGTGMVTLSALRKEVGVTFAVKTIGAGGSLRGAGIYPDDVSIAVAAVHAGILRVGESGYVRVTILPGQDAYVGLEQHGLKSTDGGKWAGSFRVDAGPAIR